MFIIAPPLAFGHFFRYRLGAKKVGFQVGIQHPIPFRFRQIDRQLTDVHSGIIYQDVYSAQFLKGLLHQLFQVFGPCDIGLANDAVSI
jgi:hypothetical protein